MWTNLLLYWSSELGCGKGLLINSLQKDQGNLMKNIILASILFLCCFVGSAQADQKTDRSFDAQQKVTELASIPVGLSVTLTPDPVSATLDSPSISGVKWEHNTTVSSMAGPVTILEFGYFVERNGQWEFSHGEEVPRTYTAGDFAKKYGCPGSELKPGKTYSNTMNRSVIDCVPEQMVKWYFIGVDTQGNRVKGEAKVKMLASVAK